MPCKTSSSFRGHIYVSVYAIGRVCAYSQRAKLFTEQNLLSSSVFAQEAQPGGLSTSYLTNNSLAFQQGRAVTPTPALGCWVQQDGLWPGSELSLCVPVPEIRKVSTSGCRTIRSKQVSWGTHCS